MVVELPHSTKMFRPAIKRALAKHQRSSKSRKRSSPQNGAAILTQRLEEKTIED